jgi:hypothetical protein
MERATSNTPYQPLSDAPDSAAADTKSTGKKREQASVGSPYKSVVQVAAKPLDQKAAPSSAPSKLVLAWAQVPTKKTLEKEMALATQISRISGPFGAFVQAACPSLSKENFAKAVNAIAQIAPLRKDASDQEVATYVKEFLPPQDVWSNDGLKPEKRADHLMKVIGECMKVSAANDLYDSFSIGGDRHATTARALWGKILD